MAVISSPSTDTPSSESPLITVRGVTKSFGDTPVLTGIDLDVHRGEVVVLLGASGSGKSTLLRTINRLVPPDSGEVCLEGRPQPTDAEGLSQLRRRLGMVFQTFNLLPDLTALENVTLAPRRILGQSEAEATERARALLARVGLSEHADKRPDTLSGGQKQRVAIARALAMDPVALLFDEPTSALDPEMVGEVLEVMQGPARDGMTMVVVTHEMGFARDVAHWVAFLDEGRIIEAAPPQEFFDHPRTDRVRQFLRRTAGNTSPA